ncbi:MAG: hypothetical protein J0H01_15185 [Rhizobiales bacterium]|nr:hypothetical protein [Hyphomicrobiales bacterium]
MPLLALTAVFSQVKGLPARSRQSIAARLIAEIRKYRRSSSNQSNMRFHDF